MLKSFSGIRWKHTFEVQRSNYRDDSNHVPTPAGSLCNGERVGVRRSDVFAIAQNLIIIYNGNASSFANFHVMPLTGDCKTTFLAPAFTRTSFLSKLHPLSLLQPFSPNPSPLHLQLVLPLRIDGR